MKIYCVHPISGLPPELVFNYYDGVRFRLKDQGWDVFTPMVGKNQLCCDVAFKAEGYGTPISSNHAIFGRDQWMVRQSDVIYANLMCADNVSIGSMMELAWASMLGKHVVVAMGANNVHRHAFVLEAATLVFDNEEEAEDYLSQLINK